MAQGRGGFSLLEVMVAAAVLVMATGSIVSAFVGASSLARSNRETSKALDAAHSALERVKGTRFDQVFETHAGSGFNVRGLEPQDGDADGLVGEIFFPGGGDELLEDVDDAVLGMPRDLNGDGIVDGDDHAADYGVLPVRVRIDWKGPEGDRSLEVVTTITGG